LDVFKVKDMRGMFFHVVVGVVVVSSSSSSFKIKM
jgi:hypothetical protein